ncbi:MAG: hypothetical protein IE909_07205 [Campylobacterales bacterium]|nr:hypothetical protein [Campylobacterales bacterium]
MKNIIFHYNNTDVEILSFDKNKMVLKVQRLDDKQILNLTMGQIPKKIKSVINPLK